MAAATRATRSHTATSLGNTATSRGHAATSLGDAATSRGNAATRLGNAAASRGNAATRLGNAVAPHAAFRWRGFCGRRRACFVAGATHKGGDHELGAHQALQLGKCAALPQPFQARRVEDDADGLGGDALGGAIGVTRRPCEALSTCTHIHTHEECAHAAAVKVRAHTERH